MAATLSRGFQKLLREPAYCEIATLMADGSPQITQVWVDTDGEHILINTADNRQKARNVRRDPRVAVNVRGTVTGITTEGANENIDRLAFKYLGQEKYPFHQPGETRVILKIRPDRINEQGVDDSAGQ